MKTKNLISATGLVILAIFMINSNAMAGRPKGGVTTPIIVNVVTINVIIHVSPEQAAGNLYWVQVKDHWGRLIGRQ